MFSLIITIVSIALVVALVAATMYHGGDTLTQGRTTADAAAFVSGAQQVGGAAVMFLSLEGDAPDTVAALVTGKYLASTPVVKGGGLELGTVGTGDAAQNVVTSTVASADVCTQINKSAGVAEGTAVTELGDLPYGCIAAGEVRNFQFKF